ncbi:MAG: hypothetical protein N2C14_24275 [Planctomycetales bacterium]
MRMNLLILAVGISFGVAARYLIKPGDVDASDSPAIVYAESVPILPANPLVPPLHIPGLRPQVDLTKAAAPDFVANWDQFAHDDRAQFHAHGEQICASGCAASRHPTKELTKKSFRDLMRQFARQPISENSLALETLLYFGRQTRLMIEKEGFEPLNQERADFLWRELGRGHASIAIRVIDENGEIRSWAPVTKVPLDRRHVFSMETNNVQPLVTSGTVKRVGLHHLWTRL